MCADHFGPDCADVFIGQQASPRCLDCAFRQIQIVVEIKYGLSRSDFQPCIAAADEANIALEPEQAGTRDILGQILRFISRPGINQNQLDRPGVVRPQG